MSDKIEEIRARHEAGERANAAADREWLLAEVERLRAALPYDWDMLQASRASLRDHMAEIKQVTRERDEARAEVERLTRERDDLLDEVESLCEALDEALEDGR